MPRLARPAVAGLVLLAACAAPKGSGTTDSTRGAAPAPATGAGGTTTPTPMSRDSSPAAQPPASAPAPPVGNPLDTAPAPEQRRLAADVQELWSGQHTALHAPQRLVVRSAAEWARLSAQLPGVPQPSIDWATHMLVVAALGERPTGGHAVQVTAFVRGASGATVTVTATRPGASCMTTQALTAPAVIARVPRVPGEVTFVERESVREC